jgi:SAM-dependent methyltransferase
MAWDQLRSSYDTVASTYEEHFVDELDAKPADRELLTAYAAATSDPVAEVGCGPGQVGALLRAEGRRVIGVDLSPAMARLAAARLDGSVAADMRALPLRAASVGGVVAFYSIIHVPRPQVNATVAELARPLRAGGRLLLSAHEGEGEMSNDNFLDSGAPFVATLFGLDELTGAAEAAGLRVVNTVRRPPYPHEHATVRLYLEAVRALA